MTDREEFEAWAINNRLELKKITYDGVVQYNGEGGRIGYIAWQAAREHYAPKLTEAQAMQAIMDNIRKLDNTIKPQDAMGAARITQ